MRFSVVFALACIISCIFAQSDSDSDSAICYLQACVSRGQSCAQNGTTIYNCQQGSYCDPDTSVCESLKVAGARCLGDDQCGDGLYCDYGEGGICIEDVVLVATGGACSMHENCYSGLCSNNVCVVSVVGEPCSGDYQCEVGTFCNSTQVCANTVALGSTCDHDVDSGSQCAGAAGCTQNSDGAYVCTAYYSIAAGGACSFETQYCAGGLACLDDGVCAVSPASSNTPCTHQSDCTGADVCLCDGNTGTMKCINLFYNNPTNIAADQTAIESCAATCQNAADLDACALQNCPTAYCDYKADTIEVTKGLLRGSYSRYGLLLSDCQVNIGITALPSECTATPAPSTPAPSTPAPSTPAPSTSSPAPTPAGPTPVQSTSTTTSDATPVRVSSVVSVVSAVVVLLSLFM